MSVGKEHSYICKWMSSSEDKAIKWRQCVVCDEIIFKNSTLNLEKSFLEGRCDELCLVQGTPAMDRLDIQDTFVSRPVILV